MPAEFQPSVAEPALNVCRFVFRGRVLWFGEASERATNEVAHRGTWLERKWDKWHQRLVNAEGHTGRLMRTLEGWLQRFETAEEPLLRALRLAADVTLIHGEDVQPGTARDEWRGFLKRNFWRHLPWLLFNLALIPIGALLTPLPGPNIIAYWFVYRAICDALAVAGTRRALGRSFPTHDRASPLVDHFSASDEGIANLASEMGWTGFRPFLKRVGALEPDHL